MTPPADIVNMPNNFSNVAYKCARTATWCTAPRSPTAGPPGASTSSQTTQTARSEEERPRLPQGPHPSVQVERTRRARSNASAGVKIASRREETPEARASSKRTNATSHTRGPAPKRANAAVKNSRV